MNAEGEAALRGQDVLELGPGSDLGAGLCLLSKDANTYCACDVHNLAIAAPDAFYEALFSRLKTDDQTIDSLRHELACCRRGRPSRLNYVVRADFDLASAFGRDTVDLVFSQAALERVDDIHATV